MSLSTKNRRFSNIFSKIRTVPSRLGRDRQRDARQVRREGRPRAVVDLRDRLADVVLDLEPLLRRHQDVVALLIGPQARDAGTPCGSSSCHSGTVPRMRSSPPVTAASAMKLPTSMWSGRSCARRRPAAAPVDRQHVRADAVDPRAHLAPAVAPGPARAARRPRSRSWSYPRSARRPSACSRSPSRRLVHEDPQARALPPAPTSDPRRPSICAPSARKASRCASRRRRPMKSPPGGGICASPKRASSGPAKRNDARIRLRQLLVDLGLGDGVGLEPKLVLAAPRRLHAEPLQQRHLASVSRIRGTLRAPAPPRSAGRRPGSAARRSCCPQRRSRRRGGAPLDHELLHQMRYSMAIGIRRLG